MSLSRTIRRAQERTDNAVHIALLGAEPNTKNTRMALAGNTASGLRRRAKQVIETARLKFIPEIHMKTINHKRPSPLVDREQSESTVTQFKAPSVHSVALYIAQQRAAARAQNADRAQA